MAQHREHTLFLQVIQVPGSAPSVVGVCHPLSDLCGHYTHVTNLHGCKTVTEDKRILKGYTGGLEP